MAGFPSRYRFFLTFQADRDTMGRQPVGGRGVARARKPVQRRIEEALTLEAEEARAANASGYMANVLMQTTIPHARVNESIVRRSNGLLTVTISNVTGSGLPYGIYPRLLLSWIAIEAVKTQEPLVEFGPTLSGFMTELGLLPTGGRWGTIQQLREQMTRLFSSSISCHHADSDADGATQLLVARDYELWWDPKRPDQAALWGSTVRLSTDFFNELAASTMLLSMNALKSLKQSAMALDVYCWFVHRFRYLRRATPIPWEALYLQFGNGFPDTPAGLQGFRKQFRQSAERVASVFPKARFETDRYYLTLLPPAVAAQGRP